MGAWGGGGVALENGDTDRRRNGRADSSMEMVVSLTIQVVCVQIILPQLR